MTRLIARTALSLACALAAPLAVIHAQAATASASQPGGAHPSLSGTWELNVAKSNFGMGGGPTKGTMVLTQAGDKITTVGTMSSSMGDMTNTMHHTVGAATTDTISAGGQSVAFTSTTRWEGPVLVVDGKAMMMGAEIPVVSRYTLSPDGKQLTIDQVVTTPAGEQTQRFIYDKKS